MSFFPPDLMLILPSRQAVSREREKLLQESRGGVLLAPKVMTFGRLENLLAEEFPTEETYISDLTMNLIMERLITEDEGFMKLTSIKNFSRGLKNRIAEFIEQCRAGGLTQDILKKAAENHDQRDMLMALAGLLSSYETLLSEKKLIDQAGRRRCIIKSLEAHNQPSMMRNIQKIIIRDFNRLTNFQIELVKALSHTISEIEVNLYCPEWAHKFDRLVGPADPDNPFNETLATIYEFEAMGEKGEGITLNLNTPPGCLSDDLTWLTDHLFRRGASHKAPPLTENIEIKAAPGRYAEVEAVGRQIYSLIDSGVRPEQIALAAPNMSVYGELVEDVFRRFNLPLFFRRGEPLHSQAPVRAVFSLLELAISKWDRERVLDLLASPYLQLNNNTPWGLISKITAAAGVTDERAGGGWLRNLSRFSESNPKYSVHTDDIIFTIDHLKKLLAPLRSNQTWREFCRNLETLLKELKLEQCIHAGNGLHLQRDALSYAVLEEILENQVKAAALAGIEKIKFTVDELIKGLKSAISGRTIGEQGDPVNGVMVLNVFDLHGLRFDHIFLVGLNDGEFPGVRSERKLLGDSLLRTINASAGKRIFKTASREYRQEELLFYHAIASSRKKVCLSYRRTDDDGRISLSSSLVDEIIRLMRSPGMIVELPQCAVPGYNEIMTPEEFFGRLASDGFNMSGEAAIPETIEYQLEKLPEYHEKWKSIVRRSRFFSTMPKKEDRDETAAVSPIILKPWLESIKKHQDSPLLSCTFLELFGQCPFVFWARGVMGLILPEDRGDEVNPMDEGNIAHQIVYRFLSRFKEENRLPLCGAPEELDSLLFIAREVMDEAEKRYSLGRRPLWRVRKKLLLNNLEIWLRQEQRLLDGFLPTHFEWSFGPDREKNPAQAPPLEIKLENNRTLFFHGRVDRIDLSKDKVRVLDYKNSSNTTKYNKLLKESELGKTSFQAPLYQVAAAGHFEKPAQAGWILLKDQAGSTRRFSTFTDAPLFTEECKARNELHSCEKPNFYNLLEETWRKIEQGVFTTSPDSGACDYCDYRTSCRYLASS